MVVTDVGGDTTSAEDGTALSKLAKSLKVTAGCRFNAARRLENHDVKLTRLIAFASAYIIALTVLPYFLKLPSGTTDLYNFVTVTLSIAILVSSLLQYSSANAVNAEQHHRSALEINELGRLLSLKAENNITEAEVRDFMGRYNAILQKYSINHDEIDFWKYQIEHHDMYPWVGCVDRIAIRATVLCKMYFLSVVLLLTTILMLGLAAFGMYQAHVFSFAN
jgi:hypothetical protein